MSLELIIVLIVVAIILVFNYTNKMPQKDNKKDGDESSSSRFRRITDRLNVKWIVTIVAILITGVMFYSYWPTFADWFSNWFASGWAGEKTGWNQEVVRKNLWLPALALAVIFGLMAYRRIKNGSDGRKTEFDPIGAFFGLIVLLVGSAIALALTAVPILLLSIVAKEFGVFDSIENIVQVKNNEVRCTTQDELTSVSRKGGFRNAKTLNICPNKGKLYFSDNKVLFRIAPDFAKKFGLKGDELKTIGKFMKIRLVGGTTYYIEPLPLKSKAGYRSMYEWLAVTSVPLQVIPDWQKKSP